MTVRINKDAINLREKLSQLDKPSGLVGEELLRADTSADAREALNLEEHLFEDFESTGIDDNATSTKVTVSDTGVDVTGTVTADGLTVDGNAEISGTNRTLTFFEDDETDLNTRFRQNNGVLLVRTTNDAGTSDTTRLRIDHATGDVQFYEDTGSTAKMTWDASAESLGIGVSTVDKVSTSGSVIEIESNLDGSELILGNSKGGTVGGEYLGGLIFKNSDGSGSSPHYSGIKAVASDTFGSANLEFYTGRENYESGTGYAMKLFGGTDTSDNKAFFSGNVGIGTASPWESLSLPFDKKISLGSSTYPFSVSRAAFGNLVTTFADSYDASNARIDFVMREGSASENTALSITGAGNVGIGTASPSDELHVKASLSPRIRIDSGITGQESQLLLINSADGLYSTVKNIGSGLGFTTQGAERARIDSSGNLLVGTTSSSVGYDSADAGIALRGKSGSLFSRDNSFAISANTNGNDGDIIRLRKDGSPVGSIGTIASSTYIGTGDTGVLFWNAQNAVTPYDTGNTVSNGVVSLGVPNYKFKDLYLSGGVITSSDYRLKEDIQPMQSYADTVKQMNLVNFAWKETGEREDGFIAHELQALVPSAVRGDKDAIDEDGNEQYQGVDPLKLIPVLTKALQEALERIETLENK